MITKKMETPTTSLQALWHLLHSWTPLSNAFRTEIAAMMRQQSVKAKQELFPQGAHLPYAWYSVDCWVAKFRSLESGQEEVSQFFQPGELLTDLTSFLKSETTQTRGLVIEGSSLLAISKAQFEQLKTYPETNLLLQEYLLRQKQKELWRTSLLSLHEKERLAQFAKFYPIHVLPGKLCASFLRMSPSHFSQAKKHYTRSL